MALASGFGVDRLRVASRPWAPFAGWAGGAAAVALAVAAVLKVAPGGLVAWSGVLESFWPRLVEVARRDAALVLLVAAAAAAVAWAVRRGMVRPGPAAALVVALAVADLARAGSGLNRQVHPSFFDLLPETSALPLRDREGGRVFSYGLDHSPAFRAFLARGGPELTLAGLYLHRQMLGPYTNMLDGIPAPEATDLTAFAPRSPRARARELRAAGRRPPAPLAAQRGGDARAQPRPADAPRAAFPSAPSPPAHPGCSSTSTRSSPRGREPTSLAA